MLVAASPVVASAAASRHAHHGARVHGRRAHAARCTLRKHASKRSRAACRARRLRNGASAGTAFAPIATITSGPAAGSVSSSSSATFTFTSSSHGGLRCSLDGAAYTLCSSPTSLRGLSNGSHTFAVYAFADTATGQPASVTWSVGTPAAPPSTPAGLTAAPGDGQVSLSWSPSSASAGIAGYRVFRNGNQIAQISTTSYTDTGLADGTSYTYAVEALDGAGSVSPLSAAVTATPQAAPVTPAPTPTPTPTTPTTPPLGTAFTAVTNTSLAGTPWKGVQCSPTTVSQAPRLRGTVVRDWTNQALAGQASYLFTLPTDSNKSTYPLEACDLTTPFQPVGVGTSGYYGLMIYVPKGWTIPNSFPYGVNIEEYHFQNVDAAPIILQLHSNNVTLALETGACHPASGPSPGCSIRSNSAYQCKSTSTYTCLPAQYAIPPGAFVQGAWNEVVMHATWETGYTGDVETWYKVKGATTWTQSTNLSGIPTVQYNINAGSPPQIYADLTEAYTGALTAPLSLSLGNYVTGSSFTSVAGTMP